MNDKIPLNIIIKTYNNINNKEGGKGKSKAIRGLNFL